MLFERRIGGLIRGACILASALLGPVAHSQSITPYANTLKDHNSVSAHFDDFTQGNGSFSSNATHGLTLATAAPNWAEGIKVWKQFLPAGKDWQVTVKARVAAFSNNQENPYYKAGITLAKFGTTLFDSYPNRLNLELARFSANGSGTSMSNFIAEGIYASNSSNSGNTLPFADVGATETALLRLVYSAGNTTASLSYSLDGNTFVPMKSYDLGQSWSLLAGNSTIALALVCSNDPYGDPAGGHRPASYSVSPGQIALFDLEIGPDSNTDAGSNGLPDAWEVQHFGSPGVDPSADADGDGTSNLMEFLAGTNPKSAASAFRATQRVEAGESVFSIPTQAGRHYRIWGTDDLRAAWTPQAVFTGNGSVHEWRHALGNSPKARFFFRWEISRQPIASFAGITVQGGTLPVSSQLNGQQVATFQIGKYEVRWDEWQEVRTWAVANGYSDLANVGAGSAGNHPVGNVSWYDVVKWMNARSEKEGFVPVYTVNGTIYRTGEFGWDGSGAVVVNSSANGYRLPTEAEWEWAARGGVGSQGYTYSGSNDVNGVAWYRDNSSGAAVNLYDGRGTWPVGQKGANELGLHDMSGNVWEWCWDVHDSYPSSRRIRGGSWFVNADYGTVANRDNGIYPDYRDSALGFRPARSSGN